MTVIRLQFILGLIPPHHHSLNPNPNPNPNLGPKIFMWLITPVFHSRPQAERHP
jgi:hypothetical protein